MGVVAIHENCMSNRTSIALLEECRGNRPDNWDMHGASHLVRNMHIWNIHTSFTRLRDLWRAGLCIRERSANASWLIRSLTVTTAFLCSGLQREVVREIGQTVFRAVDRVGKLPCEGNNREGVRGAGRNGSGSGSNNDDCACITAREKDGFQVTHKKN